jgi:hypothetical protein
MDGYPSTHVFGASVVGSTNSGRGRFLEALMATVNSQATRCPCESMGVKLLIPLSGDFLATLKHLLPMRRQDPLCWWRCYCVCEHCGAQWLVVGDIRIHDNYLLRRLSRPEAEALELQDVWPADFETFEAVLDEEVRLGHACRFYDQLDLSLQYTVEDLLLANPSISDERMAYLLNIDTDNVKRLRGMLAGNH